MERVGVRRSAERLEPARNPVKPGKVRAKSSVAENPSEAPPDNDMAGHELLAKVSAENCVSPDCASAVGTSRHTSARSKMPRMAASESAETCAENSTPRAHTSARSRSTPDDTAVSTHVPGAFHGNTCVASASSARPWLPTPKAAQNASEKPVM